MKKDLNLILMALVCILCPLVLNAQTTTTWNFGTASDYTYDSDEVVVGNGLAQLVRTFVENNIIGDDIDVSYELATADFDKDGNVDIYVANNGQNKLMMNNGDGTFTFSSVPSSDSLYSLDVEIADFNEDTYPDIYVANSSNGFPSGFPVFGTYQNYLLLNNGDGTFSSANISGDDENSYDATVGDYNNDDNLDIYVGEDGQNELWFGNGDGTFTNGNISGDTTGTYSASVTTGDFNGDTIDDLYVGNATDSAFLGIDPQQNDLWLSNGDGTFTAGDITGDNTGISYAAVTGEFNGDTDVDIYVANNNGQNDLWLNNGDGTFSAADISGDSTSSYDVEVADVNGDTIDDLYVINSSQNKLWLGDGDGTFTNADITDDDTSQNFGGTIADISGDTDLDIYLAVIRQNRYWLGNGDGTFTDNTIFGDAGNLTYGVDIGELTGDSDNDIYVTIQSADNYIWENDGDETFSYTDATSAVSGATVDVNILDIDGDGNLDTYLVQGEGLPNGFGVGLGTYTNALSFGNGDGTFTSGNISADNNISYAAAFGDFNDDDEIDIYVANYQQNYVYLNNGDRTFSAVTITGDTGEYSVGAAVGDLNGDDIDDIYVANMDSSGFGLEAEQNKLWLSNGDGTFTNADITGDASAISYDAEIADLNGDDYNDIYVSNQTQNNLWINDGAGNFTAANITGDNNNTYGSEIYDVDGDGDNDIYSLRSGQNVLWINDGAGNFTSSTTFEGLSVTTYDADFGDLNGDGYADLYVANGASEQNIIYLTRFVTAGSIQPTTGAVFDTSLASFTSTLGSNNQGTVTYQVSPDDGTTWYYWNTGAWTTTTATDGSETSSASVIDTNIATLDTDGGTFTWRAYFASDNTQPVELDAVSVTTSAPVVEESSGGPSGYRGYSPQQVAQLFAQARGEDTAEELICSLGMLTQNLKAPSKNGSYNNYTGGIVTEADLLQQNLDRLGFNPGPIDGILGPLSDGAIKRMQTFLGTLPDGYVGPLTRSALNGSCISS